ncbi:ribosome small subunit-dependent GTPase A [Rhodothermus marinus]|uniref:ribosome small subunit-dependent GTPase A n=1 Tax=Rhodothermus marinus TaxID=29549 RepID=UPI0012BA415A|nr:ribosome small subunit-dependent GTPase A [Rhodothermus marinus]BBM70022.1 putative ribosome biogenesis GTPase RsgA [Rhodothermus marinus]BBM73007.1 putative ribosome biogenesis GTPase RsgA [Rhodothermus marinus]
MTKQHNGEILEGTVIRATGSWFDVQADGRVIPSRVRGKFRLAGMDTTSPVVVGDRVKVRLNPDGTGLIVDVHPRRNELSRRAAGRRHSLRHVIAANIDFVWIVQAVHLPEPNPGFIDRVLVAAERYAIPAGLILNKIDLMTEEDRPAIEALERLYADLGYRVLRTSVVTDEGLDELREALRGKTSVVTGPSGVGKSSLLNAIEPGLNIRTAPVSEKTGKGRHTTTYVALYPLSIGGFVVDTPGLREFGVTDLEPAELSHYFVEFRPYLSACRFPDCTHEHEPDCAVKAAVASGEISEERYYSYLNILHSLKLGEKDVGR